MADTKHHHAVAASTGPTEGDGVSYSGIVWFVVILAVTTVTCQLLMYWLVKFEEGRTKAADTPRAPFAAAAPTVPPPPNLIALDSDTTGGKAPAMPLGEPTNLKHFRDAEDRILTTYDWVDRNATVVRIPIDRAKALILERGLPVRTGK